MSRSLQRSLLLFFLIFALLMPNAYADTQTHTYTYTHTHNWKTVYPDVPCMQRGEIRVECDCGAILTKIPTGLCCHSPRWQTIEQSETEKTHTEGYICASCGETLKTRKVSDIPYKAKVTRRFHIPSVGINVGLIASSAQAAADKKDGAAYFPIRDTMVIADHNYQQFKVLDRVKVGDTAYIETDGVRQSYLCTEIHRGKRTDTDIFTEDGRSLFYDYSDCLIVYTCIGRAAAHMAFAAVFVAR